MTPTTVAPVVYLARIGKHIKIGFTTNLNKRLKAFRGASAEQIDVVLTIAGGRDLERRLHRRFAQGGVINEFFRDEPVLWEFISITKDKGLAAAVEYVKWWQWSQMPRARERFAEQQRQISEKRYLEMVA